MLIDLNFINESLIYLMKIRFDSEKIITKMDDGSKECFLLGSMHSKVFQFRFYFFVLFIKKH